MEGNKSRINAAAVIAVSRNLAVSFLNPWNSHDFLPISIDKASLFPMSFSYSPEARVPCGRPAIQAESLMNGSGYGHRDGPHPGRHGCWCGKGQESGGGVDLVYRKVAGVEI